MWFSRHCCRDRSKILSTTLGKNKCPAFYGCVTQQSMCFGGKKLFWTENNKMKTIVTLELSYYEQKLAQPPTESGCIILIAYSLLKSESALTTLLWSTYLDLESVVLHLIQENKKLIYAFVEKTVRKISRREFKPVKKIFCYKMIWINRGCNNQQ